MYIQATASITKYSQTAISGTLYNGTTVLATGNIAKGSASSSSSNETMEIVYGPIGVISDTTSRNLKLRINSTDINTKSCPVIRHTDPPIILNKATSEQDPATGTRTGANITYSLDIINLGNTISTQSSGFTTHLTVLLVDTSNNVLNEQIHNTALIDKSPSSSDLQSLTKSDTVSDDQTDAATWTQKTVRIKVITTVQQTTNGGNGSTHISYSNFDVVYMAAPTIAYRSNHLGINTTAPNPTTILDIHGAQGKQLIHIGNPNQVGGRFEISIIQDNLYIDII